MCHSSLRICHNVPLLTLVNLITLNIKKSDVSVMTKSSKKHASSVSLFEIEEILNNFFLCISKSVCSQQRLI